MTGFDYPPATAGGTVMIIASGIPSSGRSCTLAPMRGALMVPGCCSKDGRIRPRYYRLTSQAFARCQYVMLTTEQYAPVLVVDIDQPGNHRRMPLKSGCRGPIDPRHAHPVRALDLHRRGLSSLVGFVVEGLAPEWVRRSIDGLKWGDVVFGCRP